MVGILDYIINGRYFFNNLLGNYSTSGLLMSNGLSKTRERFSLWIQIRTKMVKTQSYTRASRASPCGQGQKAHIGIKRLSAEYVHTGQMIVKQRKQIAFNPYVTRKRHFKIYPGENVIVTKNTSIISACHGRIKYTHDVNRDVMIVNVLPEQREELLREDTYRYRTEHVKSMEENKSLISLRMKSNKLFQKTLINPPTKPLPRPKFLGRYDQYENPTLPDTTFLYDHVRSND